MPDNKVRAKTHMRIFLASQSVTRLVFFRYMLILDLQKRIFVEGSSVCHIEIFCPESVSIYLTTWTSQNDLELSIKHAFDRIIELFSKITGVVFIKVMTAKTAKTFY